MTTMKSTLAKGLLPALLLSATLSLPVESVAAPSHGKAYAADKVKNNQKHKAQHQAKQARKQAVKAQQHARQAARHASKARPRTVVRTVVPRRVVVQQKRAVVVPQRVIVPQRRVVQRVIVPQRRVVVAPVQPVYVARNRRAWEGWNRRYSRYSTGTFRLEGTFIGQQYGCALVQDRSGQVIPLLGNPGDLRKGDHLLLSGRMQNSSVCGTAFRVSSVDRINGRDYYDDRYGRYDDRYDDDYDDRYDRGDNRNLISLDGRLDDSGRCPVIRGDRGEYYDLIGDLRDFRDGDRARVVGFLGVRSRCGGQAIDVQEIIR